MFVIIASLPSVPLAPVRVLVELDIPPAKAEPPDTA